MAREKISSPLMRQPADPKPKKEPDPRATFVVDRDLLERFKDYCYTQRISQSAGINEAIRMLLKNVKDEDLLKRPR